MPRRRLRDLNIIQNPANLEETNNDQQTAIGPSNVLNTVDEPVEIQTRYLGIIARNANLLPINYKSWHYMPDSKNQTLNNIKEKLKDKGAKYEAVTSSDCFINLDDIDNQITTEVLGLERYGRVQFQGYFDNPA
ncbi:hypothetical protein PVK06_047750 [Gossypium arboreum]|uniref:Uncharacterized protein n=1 Tax=Gossypium arboreum TaxID=29729 RepID=A0ABR0MEH7_GOSAR|nr:hypothetical protein PVK06_047750 [Gossypium arboreum]